MLRQNFLTFLVVAACGWGVWFFFGALPQIMFPVGDSGFLQGVFISDTKTSSREIGVLQKRIEDVFYRTPDIKNFVLVSGVSSFINQNMGFGFITLKPRDERRPIAEVSEDLNAQISMIPGLIANFQPEPTLKISTGATSTQQGKYSFALTSMDQNLLYSAAGAFIPKLSARRGDMFSSIQSDMYLDNPQVVLKPFRDKASMLGLSQNNYSNVFKDSYAKLFYYLIKTPFQQYWSIMEASQEYRSFESNLSALNFQSDALLTGGYPVTTLTGGGSEPNPPYSLSNLIPFDSISGTETILAPVTVNHIDNFPSVTVYFDLQPGVAIGDAVNWITKVAADSLPQGVTGQFIGEAVTFKETMMSLVYLIGVAVFVMYVILGILYESYIHPITVLSSLPIAVVGGLGSLWLFDMELSIYAMIGLFMLMGIVKKNGIMMIDFAIMREQSGMSPADAVHEACMERFRPIIMTTFAALMGMLPIALGWGKADAESRIPLGVVVVGGLIFSQVVTLYITPVIYIWLDAFQRRVLDKIPFFARGEIGKA